ncbi:hypothetical protein HU230_0012575 [Bradyrhizobium quebecense]|uniref:Exonuclease n=1 Tax=Bradyrhizobium quebecense TaxID=2748629 RepID=A0A973WRA7_9BRAD|nr:exonuclease [Bradyrhizobium quebecense]UGA46824.1 hypothetical protein HU230_0012575 [Bradyrhizobium quebecense]
MAKKVLLIDGDQFLFTACIAVEQEVRWDDQNHVLYSNAVEARRNLDGMLERIFTRFNTKEHVLCFTAGTNFRFGIDSTYKNNRAGQRKPLCYAQLREDVEASYRCTAMDTLEADDVMGILATRPQPGVQAIIVSQDKDMKTIPTTIWDGKDVVVQTEADADRFHMYQTLIGDTADGYPGCPGIGDVAATALLDAPSTWVAYEHTMKSGARKGEVETRYKTEPTDSVWKAVVSCYERAGLTEEDALRQARLARILRWSDWDSVNKKPLLWSPQR